MPALAPVRFATTLPRQHGAWSVLLLAYVLGLAVGGPNPPALLLLPPLIAALPLRHTALLWLRAGSSGRRRPLAVWLAVYGLVLILSGALLVGVYGRWLLLPPGALAGAVGLASAGLEQRRLDRTLGAELLGMVGLSLVVPATVYAASGEFGAATFGLWLLAALDFSGSVFQVRFIARGGKGVVSVIFHLLALGGAGAMGVLGFAPPLAALSLVPAALRAVWAAAVPGGRQPTIRRLGFEELGYAAVFVLLAALAYRL